jgi:hypothetical protein
MSSTKSGVLGASNPAKSAAGCRLETLARSSFLHVQRCSHCNTLSLHFGPITVRFDAESVESIWNTLGEALISLHSKREAEVEVPARDVARENSN